MSMRILFDTIDQVKDYIAVNVTSKLTTIQPYIYRAQVKFIKPLIGNDMLEALLDYKEESLNSSDSNYDGYMAGLLERIRLPLICYAYHLYTPMGQVQVSDGGIHIVVNENKKQAFQWQVDMLDKSWLNAAHDFMEEVLEYLDDNIDEFEDYEESDEYAANKSLFINSAKDFNEEVFINSSRRLFSFLRPIMKSIEKKYIKPVISEDYFDELKASIKGDSTDSESGPAEVSSDDQKIIDRIKPALSHLTMARAVSELSIEMIPEEIFENSLADRLTMRASKAAEKDKISFYIRQMQQDGEAELKALQEYLDKNASSTLYSTYYNSDCYYSPDESDYRGEYDNSSTSGIFVV